MDKEGKENSVKIGELLVVSQTESLKVVSQTAERLLKNADVKKALSIFEFKKKNGSLMYE